MSALQNMKESCCHLIGNTATHKSQLKIEAKVVVAPVSRGILTISAPGRFTVSYKIMCCIDEKLLRLHVNLIFWSSDYLPTNIIISVHARTVTVVCLSMLFVTTVI